jgi:hypothetical protein
MPSGIILENERPTSNVQHRTSNNDVASLHNLISSVFINPMPNLEWLFVFLFSRFDTHNEILNPKSRFVVISVGQKTIKQGYTNQRRHDDNVSDALRVQHEILKGLESFHSCNLT